MANAVNKISRVWISTETPETLDSDWVVDPIFDDYARAMTLGPKYWVFSGQNVHVLTDQEIDADATLLAEAKSVIKKSINAWRTEWMNDYFTYDAKQWDSNDEAVTNITGTLLIGLVNGNALPVGFEFRDHNNTNHVVDFMYMVYMAIALMTFKKLTYTACWQHKAAVDALTTVSAVKAYDYQSTLWPSKD